MAKTYLRTGRIAWSPLTASQKTMLANVAGVAIGSTFSATLDSPTETFLVGNGVISVPSSAVVASSGDTVGNVPVDNGDGTYSWGAASGGSGGQPGVPIVRAFPFAHDTPDLLTGAPVYTPTVGDIMLDAWVEITEDWDGSGPTCDFGSFVHNNTGLVAVFSSALDSPTTTGFALWPAFGTALDGPFFGNHGAEAGYSHGNSWNGPLSAMYAAIMPTANFDGLYVVSGATWGFASNSLDARKGDRLLPLKFTTTDPMKVVVSQDGRNDGADPGNTQGGAILYLITATPV